ncbi:D-alanyl-D-alanine carboxypeptidase/D-alanyl-D-alanine endopeptidase [Sulfurisoma sediminicola]|uniref:D-alanyl-D-alanine carboxypeptidase/D-alanyl-D-alanine-endopeptidase (Penicillin-binding protein 4) n=1 Tax=Sulfurisoma sediminicola TaxID=1381557 RepID=A0A497XMF1_9PROT|nr:D-alanyl-D-alanine carboxypeptidase/D-alanyl-D-alanine-endopeptidase [Sulfurisoma sediminicola]RLJ68600.1 D-alanyl-D-alanine carboxypeptidase/D-alanyl-D-alanine-endopeptidase (penicillin-binding protein 4) [Sulfurisoma sediminicola]
MALLLRLLLLLLPVLPAAAQNVAYDERLPIPVARALKAAGIPQSAVGVVVQETGAVFPRVGVNANAAMNPASVMKLVTTFAALELLGPAYTWKTSALAATPLSLPPADGVLPGDLHLVGSGDPKLTFEQFWLLLRQLRARGVREIRGDLVLDRSAFAAIPHDEAAFDDKPLRPYNVGPDALLLNFKAVRLTLAPEGGRILVLAEPAPANLDIVNLLKTGSGPCPPGSEWREALRADLASHGNSFRLVLTGTYPTACGEQKWNIGLLGHPHYVLGVFRQLWSELGGSLAGGVRDGAPPAGARLLASVESPQLAEIVRDINKFSNNVMARQLFLTLGQKVPPSASISNGGATTAQADAAVRAWLEAKALRMPELVLDNGSGLSRRERISAESTARLLQAAWKSPVMPELMASLPLLAVDGTMKKRLRDGSAAGQAHIKTGSLEGVKTMAGYVLDKSGRHQIVVFFVNHPHAAAAQPAQDALLQWVYERAP